MPRVLDVDAQQQRIKIDFPYDPELVDVVRTLPDRSFDRRTKCWFVPLKHLEYVIDRLEGYHFKCSPQLRRIRSRESTEQTPRSTIGEIPEGTWTISRLNQAAKAALRERFDDRIWIVGELQDYDKNRNGRYQTYFFDLVERPFEGASEVAKIKAVMFDEHRQTIRRRLRDSDLELSDGLSVRLAGRVDLYHRNGRYQFRVEDIDPAFTVGEIALNRERVVRLLKKKGIASANLERPWPVCPLRVGLITSYDSDAYNDFVHQLRHSGRGFSVTVFDVNVQGTKTEPTVLKALEYFRRRRRDFDVVVIVRGGGSRSELSYFDTEAIGKAVCEHPIKVMCGVGHQRDTSLLDMIAESTKTPTAAAEALVARVQDFVDRIDRTYEAIAVEVQRRMDVQRRRLRTRVGRFQRVVTRNLERGKRRLERMETAVVERSRGTLKTRRRQMETATRTLASLRRRKLKRQRRRVDRAQKGLSPERMSRQLKRKRERLQTAVDRLQQAVRRQIADRRRRFDHLDEQLRLMDPKRVLKRGFAIARSEDGVIRSRDDIAYGCDFDVVVGDGILRARRLEEEDEDCETSATKKPTTEPAE